MPSLSASVRTVRTWLSVWAAGPTERSYRVYELYERDKLPTESSAYMNLGYWIDDCATLDQAGDNLAELVAQEGGFAEGQRILDAGCGFGEQDFYWLRTRSPANIVALNLTARHLDWARDRAVREGVADRLEFRRHSATALDYGDATFDRVVALESAFHFDPRQEFFAQAHRVLRPGGVLVTADLTPMPGTGAAPAPPGGLAGPLASEIPAENWHTADVYRQRLLDAGFASARLRSIREQVYRPWAEHMVTKSRTPEFRRKFGFAANVMAKGFQRYQEGPYLDQMDYIVAVAEK